MGVKAIDLKHSSGMRSLVRSSLTRVCVRWLDGDLNTNNKWDFVADLLFLIINKVQVEGGANLEHADKRDIANQGFYEGFNTIWTFSCGAPCLLARPGGL